MLNDITTYALMLLYYSLFFIAVTISYKKGSGQLKNVLSGKGEPIRLFSRLISGVFILGIGTVTLFAKSNVDIEIFTPVWNDYHTSVWVLIAAAIAIGSFSAFKKLSPADNSGPFLPFYLPLSFVFIRTLFLIVYESFFRGIVLFIMMEDLGAIAAIIINLILYALVHWFDKKERYGSLLMGIILCSVSIYYHSVWPAIIIHLSLALSHEITLLINNKSLIKKSWS